MGVRAVGIDIASTAVRVADVELGNAKQGALADATLHGFGEAAVPPGAVLGGDVVDVRSVSIAMKQAMSAAGAATKAVRLGVSSESVIVREIEVPAMPMAQLRKALPFQVQEMLPMAASDVILDFFPTAEVNRDGASLLRGVLVAAPKGVVLSIVAAAESAGLKPQSIDLDGFALYRAEYPREAIARHVALVDIGARMTTIVITQDGRPRLARTVAGGGQSITDAIASAVRIGVPEAEDVKRRVGLTPPASPEYQLVHEAITQATANLVDAIRKTLVYFASSNPGEGAEHIVLSGGGSQMIGFGQFIASTTRLPVTMGSAATRVSPHRKLKGDPEAWAARGTMATGLALREDS